MNDIDVRTTATAGGWTCALTVRSAAGTTTHEVGVTQADLERLAPGATEPTDLVRLAFAFLLEREPATSILRSFDLPEIGRYFPEFEREIRDAREPGGVTGS